MKISQWGAVGVSLLTLGLVTTADAALVSRLGGQAVYDTDLNITWLADANLATSNTFGVTGIASNGAMTWDMASSWITAMNADGGTGYLGFNGWRLPATLVPDSSCTNLDGTPNNFSQGINCTGSEMGHLFYNEFGATANTSVLATGDPAQLAKFTNVQSANYWSTEMVDFPASAWYFIFPDGSQLGDFKTNHHFTWAVRPGDVGLSSVPVPAAVWLFGSGLMGLLGLAKRSLGHRGEVL